MQAIGVCTIILVCTIEVESEVNNGVFYPKVQVVTKWIDLHMNQSD